LQILSHISLASLIILLINIRVDGKSEVYYKNSLWIGIGNFTERNWVKGIILECPFRELLNGLK